MLSKSSVLLRVGAVLVGLVVAVFGARRGKVGTATIGLGLIALGLVELWRHRDAVLPGSSDD
jgi:hypothetical protein